MRTGSLFLLLMMLTPLSAFGAGPACERIAAEVNTLKFDLIHNAQNPAVPAQILLDTRDALNVAMEDLNTAAPADESCEASELSGRIAQILQAVSDLELRSAQVRTQLE